MVRKHYTRIERERASMESRIGLILKHVREKIGSVFSFKELIQNKKDKYDVVVTYISVLERTKEIGILRAIGASKKDVARVFNAETVIIGLGAGLIGVGMTMLLNIPINIIVRNLTGIMSLTSALPVAGAVGLVIISVVLTFIAGLIPSGLAAKKDPVDALRTE